MGRAGIKVSMEKLGFLTHKINTEPEGQGGTYSNKILNHIFRACSGGRSEFGPGEAGAEAAKLKKFSDGSEVKFSGCPTPAGSNF